MKSLTVIDAMRLLAIATKKPCMYIAGWDWYEGVDLIELIRQAAPYLTDSNEDSQLIADGCGILVFENEAEMGQYYWQTVGDDGPTLTNSYDGPVKVYALTCSAEGEMLNENT